jgi:hypothetical protein
VRNGNDDDDGVCSRDAGVMTTLDANSVATLAHQCHMISQFTSLHIYMRAGSDKMHILLFSMHSNLC